MGQTHYRIGEASALLGLQDKNSNTLRSWVEEFKDYLGAPANPDPGRPRYFSDDDIRVLRTVRDLRVHHLPYSEIRDRLAHGAHAVEQQEISEPPMGTPEHLDRHSAKEPGTSLIVPDQLQALIAPLTRAVDEWRGLAEQYRSRLEDREARVSSLEQRLDGLQTRLEDLHNQSLRQHDEALALAGRILDAQPRSQREQPAPRRKWLGIF